MDYANIIADEFKNLLTNNNAMFQNKSEIGQLTTPYNPVTGLPYPGAMQIRLMAKSHDPRWLTMEQMTQNGYMVKPGAKSVSHPFTVTSETVMQFDANTGKNISITRPLDKPATLLVEVYNARDIIGMQPMEAKVQDNKELFKKAENMINNSGINFVHTGTDKSDHHFIPNTKTIYMPGKHRFPNQAEYYATSVYELAKAKSYTLDKNMDNTRASLYAALASRMLAAETGMNTIPQTNKEMTQKWLDMLNKNPREVFKACKAAENIKNALVRDANFQVLKMEQTKTHTMSYGRKAAGLEY